ncbi:hypothetical protein STCU_05563 [Strigomonas culicis]|uniref:Uncharacterized protein n=1 Tax=Strigomonas culicis TaxID=28005 RepID=S9VW74_9TRYP|nr:hypothetical protein STCU_05563 [Strigomonas culicis]|eukprot:EPY27775.1 hypothetical protein STCU_05563 [Strigomonas culicis]
MLLEIVAFLCCVVAYWWCQLRPRSPFNLRPPYQNAFIQSGTEYGTPLVFDYVVVGGGPAGLAAVHRLCREDAKGSVLLIESGSDASATNVVEAHVRAVDPAVCVSYSPDHIRIPAGAVPGPLALRPGSVHTRPFVLRRPLRAREEAAAATATGEAAAGSALVTDAKQQQRAEQEFFLLNPPYVRGIGLGGGALMDWGMHLPSLVRASGDKDEASASSSWYDKLPIAQPFMQSPLSCAFVDAMQAVLPHFKKDKDFCCPLRQRLDADFKRLPLSNYVLSSADIHLGTLRVLTGYKVVALHTPDTVSETTAPHVSSIRCVSTLNAAVEVVLTVRKGVVLACGVVESPRLLARLYASLSLPVPPLDIRDAIALPIVYKSYHSLSYDACNTRDLRALVSWYLCQRGPSLHPLCDAIARFPLRELGPHAAASVLLIPQGGRDAPKYYRLGWDRALASFQEGFVVLVVLEHVCFDAAKEEGPAAGALRFSLDAETSAASQASFQRRGVTPLTSAETPSLLLPNGKDAALAERVSKAFRGAMRKVREIMKTAPVAHLCTGSEAVDFTLLKEDAEKAMRLARLVHTPYKKFTRKMKLEVVELSDWATHCARQEPYMDRYVKQHAYWLGYGWGSSEPFVAPERPLFARETANVVVGDTSAVTERMWRDGDRRTLHAGGVCTAMDMGCAAAEALLAAAPLTERDSQ